ncbi:MAG: SH3 domain-containing protein [Spirochaetia bacterium]|nr:SH3 domain-containing protein [Spirochaetia bacterium]
MRGRLLPIVCVLAMVSASCGKKAADTAKIPEFAEITVDTATLRIDPLVSSAELETLPKGTKLRIVKKRADEATIGGNRDHWYFVRLESGMEGWIFGSSIALKGDGAEGDVVAVKDTMTEKDIVDKVTGKWWQMNVDGSTGFLKVYFWADGKYKHGWGSAPMQEGKYTANTSEAAVILDKGSAAGDKLKLQMVGRELRLFGEKDGKRIVFRQGGNDPEASEVGEDKKKEKSATAKPADNAAKPAQ